MVNLREAYKHSDERMPLILVSVLAVLVFAVLGVVFLSPTFVLGTLIAIVFLFLTIVKPLWSLAFLSVYLPFEPFLLKWMPDDLYLFARFFSEGLVYLIFVVALIRMLSRGERFRANPLTMPFIFFLIALGASSVFNLVDPTIALFGIRSIIRFILIYFAVIMLRPDKAFVHRLTMVLFGVVCLQAAIALTQAVVGTPLDTFLLPSETRTFGEFQITEGTIQFWDAGSRVFATLGRYDRLGVFLAFFLIIAASFLYEKLVRAERKELPWLFLLGIPALILTYSRSSWFGFVLGFLFIALYVRRDRKVLIGLGVIAAVIVGYLAYTGIIVNSLIDVPQQTVAERFFEAFSYERWQGEYYGLGRLFWVVQTVTSVVPAAPIFGWGPGMYGGGTAILFHNTKVYDTLGLPFGVYGTAGYIDNNWFSIWGETGTLGIGFFLWMYLALFFYALRVGRASKDPFICSLAFGFAGAMIAVALNAFLATFFEVRSLAIYLWMYAGFVAVLGEEEKVI